MRARPLFALAAAVAAVALGLPAAASGPTATVTLREPRLAPATMSALRHDFVDQLLARYRPGTWAPMRMVLDDRDLALMGLPSASWLRSHHFSGPTFVSRRKGGGATANPLGLPTLASYAGAGWFGIRPGAWLLTVTDQEVGWCSLAHVYGSPGSYQISTAGHCGKPGTVATVVAAFGNRGDATGVVLLDFGTFAKSRSGGIGKDWALIKVDPAYQSLVTPTMAFWGGPQGEYTPTGDVVGADLLARKGPSVGVDPNPSLAQVVVHYGHGAGVGTGGTPRVGTAITWRPTYYAFFGAITPGDSGSGANVLTGWPAGSLRQAAGINTHIYVDSSLRTGLGTMAGTRVTQVPATLANGQLLPYPVPVPGAP